VHQHGDHDTTPDITRFIMASNYTLDNAVYTSVRTVTCSIHADNVFGPVVALPCRQGFDFTLLFEQSVLSIGPSCIFLLVLPLRLFWLYRSKATPVVPRHIVYTRKAVRFPLSTFI
jgi:ATP-binding cassette subfamily C (CFTR/MRP) protein 1